VASRRRQLRGPYRPEEAEALELGGRMAIFRSHQPLLFNEPTWDA
jgi:hypothetical protein